jgi:hypothetical protein
MTRLLAILALALLAAPAAQAHTQSYGFLSLSLADDAASGRLELAVRDLDRVHDLDADRDGKITWGEFRARETELARAVLAGIAVGAPGSPCALAADPAMTDTRGGETYIVLPFRGSCPAQGGATQIGYDLFFAGDAQHRGLVAATTGAGTQTFVMTPATPRVSLAPADGGGFGRWLGFVEDGAHHIFIGYDHIVFLLTLLIGSFAMRGEGRPFKQRFYEAVKVVTAFTVAHSLTLGLAAFGFVTVPTSLTESLIAITITLAALNNIWPVVSRRLWLVALGFGLVHGLGFANVLAELDLPRENLLGALFAFNLGVELGQLAILFAALPLIVLFTRTAVLDRIAVPAVNLGIAAVGAMWFADRALGTAILPF